MIKNAHEYTHHFSVVINPKCRSWLNIAQNIQASILYFFWTESIHWYEPFDWWILVKKIIIIVLVPCSKDLPFVVRTHLYQNSLHVKYEKKTNTKNWVDHTFHKLLKWCSCQHFIEKKYCIVYRAIDTMIYKYNNNEKKIVRHRI